MAIERRLQVYRRKRGSELWHFVPDCSERPRWHFDERALPAAEFERFAAYLTIADKMIEQSSKGDLAETARVLALHLAHYRAQHGEIPLRKAFDLLTRETLDDRQAGELADGFGVLIKVIQTLRAPGEGAH